MSEPISNYGGTSAEEFQIAKNGDLILRNGDAWVVDGSEGTTGQVLTSNGTGVSPSWETSSGGVSLVEIMAFAGAI